MNEDEVLSRRAWLLSNLDYLMAEVEFHKDNLRVFKQPRIDVWVYDEELGSASIP